MTRALQPDDPRIPEMEKELGKMEAERIQRTTDGSM
jgi:hypothetical protein